MKRDSGVGGPTAGTAAPPKTNGGRRKNGASAAATGEQRRDENKKSRSTSIPGGSPSRFNRQQQATARQTFRVTGGKAAFDSNALQLSHHTAAAAASVDAMEGSRPATAATAAGGVCGNTARPPRSPTEDSTAECTGGASGGERSAAAGGVANKARGPTLEDALDDVQVRFVLNLPEAELSSADRLFFQLEQAWWFYEDFIADAHPHLPHFRLKEFSKMMFQHCEALRPLSAKYNELFEHFKSWKGTIPTAGCILLNADMTKLVLVKGWKGNSRGLPKGKINEGEPARDAALREVLEETGYDASSGASEKDFLTLYVNGQQSTMYIVPNVDEGFPFVPQVRKEISAVEWFPLDALPKGTFGVEPFMPRLRRWMAKTRGMPAPKEATAEARTTSTIRLRKKGRATSPDVRTEAAAAVALNQSIPSSPPGKVPSETTPKKPNRKQGGGAKGAGAGTKHGNGGSSKGTAGRANSAPSRRVKGYDAHNRDTFGVENGGGGGGGGGGSGRNNEGWGFEEMLAANERLTGRTFTYDGNPHEFGDPVATADHEVDANDAQPAESATTASSDAVGGSTGGCVGGMAAELSHAHPFHVARKEDQVAHLRARNPHVHTHLHAHHHNHHPHLPNNGTGVVGVVTSTTSATAALAAAPTVDEEGGHCSQGTSAGSCTERASAGGVGEDGCQSTVTNGFDLWSSEAAPSSSTPVSGGGLFGEFKFDMLDIMRAVPQG